LARKGIRLPVCKEMARMAGQANHGKFLGRSALEGSRRHSNARSRPVPCSAIDQGVGYCTLEGVPQRDTIKLAEFK